MAGFQAMPVREYVSSPRRAVHLIFLPSAAMRSKTLFAGFFTIRSNLLYARQSPSQDPAPLSPSLLEEKAGGEGA